LRPLNFLDVMEFLRARWLRVGAWAVGFAVVAYLVSFLVPPVFQARAVILPPDDDDLASAFSAQRRSLGSFGALSRLGGGSYFTQGDVAMATLRSRTAREQLEQRFHLAAVYKQKSVDDVDHTLAGNSSIQTANDGTITVTVKDASAQRAADLANGYLDALDDLNRVFRTLRARRTRVFLEQRVAQTDSTLHDAERQLVAYQSRKGSLVLPPDASVEGQTGAALIAQKLQADVQLALIGTYASPQSEVYRAQQVQVEELGRQIGRLPATQTGAAEIVRRVAIQQQLLALLTSQLEDARIREIMDMPTIQVLEAARPPQRHIWPRRSLLALFGFVVGLTFCIALEWWRAGA